MHIDPSIAQSLVTGLVCVLIGSHWGRQSERANQAKAPLPEVEFSPRQSGFVTAVIFSDISAGQAQNTRFVMVKDSNIAIELQTHLYKKASKPRVVEIGHYKILEKMEDLQEDYS